MKSNIPARKYSAIGVCGLECGLCPRHHSSGASACPGCGGEGFWERHPGCARLRCAAERHVETCAQCPEYQECPRALRTLDTKVDSFISYKTLPANNALIREQGIEECVRRLVEKQKVLARLLSGYDDGRAKSFYCLACQLLPTDRLEKALAEVPAGLGADSTRKQKAAAMRSAISAIAAGLGIELKLRK